MAMITSAKNKPWPGDVRITDLESAGLPAHSVVRMKLFTLDHQLVIDNAGHLTEIDAREVTKVLTETLGQVDM